jgi:superfamily II DNA or RNA helicase
VLVLREHQQEVVDKLREGFEQGHTRQLLYAPTGFGKTEVAMSIMQKVSEKFKKTAMVLDRIVLVDQTSIRLNKYGIDHGVMQAGHWRKRPLERIQICSAQTLEKRKTALDIDLLIIDECHIARKKTIEFMKANPQIKVIGLTATPFTKGLGDIYTHVVGASTTGDLIEKNWLVPLKVFISKEIDMSGAKKLAGEWSASEATKRGMQITGDIVGEWIKKTHEVFGGPRKTIVFCSGVDHGRDLVKQFADAGFNFVSISYKEDDQYKKDMIEAFSQPDTEIHGLIATDILTRGFDVTDVMIGVSARPFSKSFSSHVQQLGRVMRPHEGKTFGLWLDHSGNFLRFRDDWDQLYTEGVKKLEEGGSEKAKRELTEKEKKAAKCPECSAIWESKTNVCHNCGHIRQSLSTILHIHGELEELEQSNKKLRIASSQFYAELMYYGRLKGYKDGWAAIKYKEKFGVYPNGMNVEPKAPTIDTLKWVKSRMIAYSKGKAKTIDRIAA